MNKNNERTLPHSPLYRYCTSTGQATANTCNFLYFSFQPFYLWGWEKLNSSSPSRGGGAIACLTGDAPNSSRNGSSPRRKFILQEDPLWNGFSFMCSITCMFLEVNTNLQRISTPSCLAIRNILSSFSFIVPEATGKNLWLWRKVSHSLIVGILVAVNSRWNPGGKSFQFKENFDGSHETWLSSSMLDGVWWGLSSLELNSTSSSFCSSSEDGLVSLVLE